MAHRVVLHIGAMKSGTSYLQSLLMANRDLLEERGVLLPGRVWRDQVSGVAEVIERKKVAVAPQPGAWQALVDQVGEWPGTGLISMEFLARVGLGKIEKVVSSFPAGTVEVVVTARDLARNIPGMWQESVKNGAQVGLDEYLEAIRAHDGPGSNFWREQTIAAMCRRWSEVVGVDRVTLVTVPHPGAATDTLWQRFATAIGVDPSGVVQPPRTNESLGAASVEVLRRLNVLLADLEFADYAPVVKHRLAKSVLVARKSEEPSIGLDVPDWLPPLAQRMRERIEDLGVRVVGDLADLEPVPTSGVSPSSVPVAEQLDAAVVGLEALVRALVRTKQ